MKIGDIFSFSRIKWQKEIVPFPSELKNIEMIKIVHCQTKKSAEFTTEDIENFLEFMRRGSCKKIAKSATRYQICIRHEEGTSYYYVHGDFLGPEERDLVQIIFEPKKRGFELFLYSFFEHAALS